MLERAVSRPKTLSSHKTTAITITAFRMALIFESIGT
jgi:hypothetical protein